MAYKIEVLCGLFWNLKEEKMPSWTIYGRPGKHMYVKVNRVYCNSIGYLPAGKTEYIAS